MGGWSPRPQRLGGQYMYIHIVIARGTMRTGEVACRDIVAAGRVANQCQFTIGRVAINGIKTVAVGRTKSDKAVTNPLLAFRKQF